MSFTFLKLGENYEVMLVSQVSILSFELYLYGGGSGDCSLILITRCHHNLKIRLKKGLSQGGLILFDPFNTCSQGCSQI